MAPRPLPKVRDMIIAMLVLLVPIMLIYAWFTRIPDDTVRPVDWQAVLAVAKAEASYPVAAPVNLPPTWTAVRARWTPKGDPGLDGEPAIGDTWQLGFLTPERIYIGLDQRDVDQAGLVTKATRTGVRSGEVVLSGRTWTTWESRDRRTRSLSRQDSSSVVVISGDLPLVQLQAFVGTLG
ncbi:MAG: DUF4245 domain-containing protein [Micropruina sp.]